MDGGVLQEQVAEQLKREVKERASQRRAAAAAASLHSSRVSDGGVSHTTTEHHSSDVSAGSEAARDDSDTTASESPKTHPGTSTVPPQRGHDCRLSGKYARDRVAFGRSDTVLLVFYLEHLFPFLFPFYQPSILEGGRAWILEMMISSPVVRHATLCQSSYFFSLARAVQDEDMIWETMLEQSVDAFGVLRQSLQVFDGSSVTEHVHGAARIISGILQVQRFEIAVLGFTNCRVHLNAALVLFKQLLDSPVSGQATKPREQFDEILDRLGPPSRIEPGPIPILSAEQAAFRFSSALLIFDDIIASTILQEKPTLYEYHDSLLGDIHSTEAPVNLETVMGCQNWALRCISEIAMLDNWKKQCQNAGTLNVMDLVNRATPIKTALESLVQQLEMDMEVFPTAGTKSLLDLFAAAHDNHTSSTLGGTTSLVTRVWAHAALAYLFVVVSGWQPASMEVRHHVSQILELLTCGMLQPALLRTMVWPFCVAGCLAEPSQEARFRHMVEILQPPKVFGTVRKAFEIMENVWRNRDAVHAADHSLAAWFGSQANLVLLV